MYTQCLCGGDSVYTISPQSQCEYLAGNSKTFLGTYLGEISHCYTLLWPQSTCIDITISNLTNFYKFIEDSLFFFFSSHLLIYYHLQTREYHHLHWNYHHYAITTLCYYHHFVITITLLLPPPLCNYHHYIFSSFLEFNNGNINKCGEKKEKQQWLFMEFVKICHVWIGNINTCGHNTM